MSRRFARYLIGGVLALSLGATPARSSHPDNISLAVYPGDVVLSPANPGSSVVLEFDPGWIVEQTVTVATAGKLLGIAVSAERWTAGPGDSLILSLRNDTTSTFLGTVSLPAQALGVAAPGPTLSAAGPGYFDLSGLDISLTPGHVLSLMLSTVTGPGVCNLATFSCTTGPVGDSCTTSTDCIGKIRLRFGLEYPGGSANIVGGPPVGGDIAFAVAVRPAAPPANALTLCWQGTSSLYHIHRSEDAETLLDVSQILTEKNGASFGDTPPAGQVWFYAVLNLPAPYPFNPLPYYTEPVVPGPIVGQTFTTGQPGDLLGIEIAPLRDTAVPGDTLILDLYGAGDTLLASAVIPASAFPPGGEETVPAELLADEFGVGYFDLSPFDIQVTSQQALRFEVRPGVPAGVCDTQARLCTVGKVGAYCVSNDQCDRGMRIGATPGTFHEGDMTVDGLPNGSADLAFKVVVRP